jgi:hypothetical protein
MPRVTTAFAAEDIRDEGGGKYIAIGLYAGEVEFKTIEEAKLDRFVVFTVFTEITPGDHSFTLEAVGSTAGRLKIGGGDFTIEDENTRFISIARLRGMFFPKSGDYTIEVGVDGEVVSAIEFGVTILAENESPSEDEPRDT